MKRNSGKWNRGWRQRKRFSLFNLNEDMNDIIKVIRFRCITWWYYWNSKTWNKKRRRWISSCFFSTFGCFISATSNFFSSKRVKVISGRGVRREGRGYMDRSWQFHVILYAISRLLSILITNLDLMACF